MLQKKSYPSHKDVFIDGICPIDNELVSIKAVYSKEYLPGPKSHLPGRDVYLRPCQFECYYKHEKGLCNIPNSECPIFKNAIQIIPADEIVK